jgi:hypothetical protein
LFGSRQQSLRAMGAVEFDIRGRLEGYGILH